MSLLDKVKTQAEQTAAKAREGVHDVQARRELSQAYAEFGKVAFELAERNEISHAELAPGTQRIRDLRAEAEAGSDGDAA